jgi:hypothetical protein
MLEYLLDFSESEIPLSCSSPKNGQPPRPASVEKSVSEIRENPPSSSLNSEETFCVD